MGLKSEIDSIILQQFNVFKTVPATYGAGAHIVMTVTGGPIQVLLMAEYLDTALGGATTTTHTLNGVAMDAGGVAINAGGVGSIVVVPGAAAVKVASALAVPQPSLTAFAGGALGYVAGPSALGWSVTFGGAAMGAAERVSFIMVYRKLSLASLVS